MAAQIEMPITEQMERKPDTFLALIDKAIAQNVSADVIGKMLDHYERWQRIEAKKVFDEAMMAFKSHPPVLKKNRTASIEKGGQKVFGYAWADLENAAETIGPALLAHGFTYRWNSSATERGYFVTCILTHKQGHSEETTIGPAPMDNGGGKSPVQGVGSTTTFLQRYSFLAAVGIVPKGLDNDGQQAKQGGKMDEKERDERLAHFDKVMSYQETDEHYKNSYREAHKAKDQEAMDMFIAARKKAYARLKEKQA